MNDITLNDIDEVHTIKTLAKFWTDADKAGKIELLEIWPKVQKMTKLAILSHENIK